MILEYEICNDGRETEREREEKRSAVRGASRLQIIKQPSSYNCAVSEATNHRVGFRCDAIMLYIYLQNDEMAGTVFINRMIAPEAYKNSSVASWCHLRRIAPSVLCVAETECV